MYYLYNVLVYLAAPFAILVQLWRGLRDASYRERLGERLGLGPAIPGETIWIHAVSVGEVQAAHPLIAQLQKRHPHYGILLTTVTPTGAARARLLFGDRVHLRYVPLDLPGSVKRFFDRVQPKLAMILETELWPNLYRECGRRGIPLVLASARISPRSVGKYRRLVSLFRKTLSHGIVIAAQSASDAKRFQSIGATSGRTHVTGNIKFDFQPPAGIEAQGRRWREEQAPGRPIWVAGSTHEGEESIVLDAHRRVLERFPEALLVLVPRHPQRFEGVRDLLAKRHERAAIPVLRGTDLAGDQRAARRHDGRADDFLRSRGRRIRRRQPAPDRRPQPARTGLGRSAGTHRTEQLQWRRDRATPDRRRRSGRRLGLRRTRPRSEGTSRRRQPALGHGCRGPGGARCQSRSP